MFTVKYTIEDREINMVECEFHIKCSTHSAHIRVYEDKVFCFKYNRRHCDWDIFTSEEAASDYLFKPLDPIIWGIEFED